jgi:molecular chaperone GrpE
VTKKDHPTWPEAPATDVVEDELLVDAESEGPEPGEDALAKAIAERDDYLDQLQRSRAEFINYKRRNDQERAQLRQFVARDVLAQFLPVIDDFDRALMSVPDEERETGWMKGVAMIQTKLHGIAERLGVTQVEALGQPFDPSVHEAVATEPGTSGSHVIEVYQNGYRIGDVLVRPAMVKTGDPAPDAGNDDNDDADTAFDA